MENNDTTMQRLSPAPAMITSAVLLIAALLSGCGQQESAQGAAQGAAPQAAGVEPAAASAPPSFLDEPPPPPQSDTIILSGGTLLGDEDQFDAVVVVQGMRVIAAGKRGTVPVPPDSIGIDTSGKFIAAVDPDVTLIGGPAELIVYDAHPETSPDARIHARVVAGEWQLQAPE